VRVYSGLIETAHIPWLEDRQRHPYLLAPFTCYELPRLPVPLPPSFESETERRYFEADVQPLLAGNDRLLFIALQMRARGSGYRYVHQRLIEAFTDAGFEAKELPGGDLVKVYELQRAGSE